MNFFSKLGSIFFGGSSDKGIVEQAADTVERFNPGAVKQHEMSIEDQKAGDDSQRNAQQLVLQTGGDNWFDIIVNGLNRLVRPVITYWVVLVLFGLVTVPSDYWGKIPDMMWNIIWTVITFWFGARAVFKDIPSAIRQWRNK